MGIGLPPPVERPNPYATFVRTFLQARNAQREYQDNEDRLKIAKEEEKARREAEKVAKEQWKQQQDLRNSEFEFQKLDAERKFKQAELSHQWERAQSFSKMRNPTPGQPFSLQLPLSVDQPPMNVQPVTWDDTQQAQKEAEARQLTNAQTLKSSPGEPPETYQVPPNMGLPGLDGQSVPAPILSAAVSMHNASQAAQVAREGREFDRAPVLLRDPISGELTGLLNRRTTEVTPVGKGLRTAPIPPAELQKLDEGTAALSAVGEVKQGIKEFQSTSFLDPYQKAKAGIRLNNTMNALSRTVGRNMGEKGMFTDQDKADFTNFLGPGIVFSTLDSGEQNRRIEIAERLLTKMMSNRANSFYSRYGTLPEDKHQFLSLGSTLLKTSGTNSLGLPLPPR